MSLSNGLLKEGSLKFLDFRRDVTYRNQLIPSVWLANFLTDNNIPWIAKSAVFLCYAFFVYTFGVFAQKLPTAKSCWARCYIQR